VVTDVLDVLEDEPLLHAASVRAAIATKAGKVRLMAWTVALPVEAGSDAAC
jgi:hypothetical protein